MAKRTVCCEVTEELFQRLDRACEFLSMKRNALMVGMLLEKLPEIEKEMKPDTYST